MALNKITAIIITLAFIGCNSKYDKSNYHGSSRISDKLYMEVYETYSGGVFAGNSYSYYITDSVNFHQFVEHKNHDIERVSWSLKNDTLIVIKHLNSNDSTIKKINIIDLRKEK